MTDERNAKPDDGGYTGDLEAAQPGDDWIEAHMGRTSQQTVARLLSAPQPKPPSGSPLISLRSVHARCVAAGASNFWIVGHAAAEPILDGEYPLIGISPTAYFVQAPEYNWLPYAVRRQDLDAANHSIAGDLTALQREMEKAYG